MAITTQLTLSIYTVVCAGKHTLACTRTQTAGAVGGEEAVFQPFLSIPGL